MSIVVSKVDERMQANLQKQNLNKCTNKQTSENEPVNTHTCRYIISLQKFKETFSIFRAFSFNIKATFPPYLYYIYLAFFVFRKDLIVLVTIYETTIKKLLGEICCDVISQH